MLFLLSTIFGPDADLLEREVYDFYGVKFLGHPDMRSSLLEKRL